MMTHTPILPLASTNGVQWIQRNSPSTSSLREPREGGGGG
jgi:hypothetical protein